MRFWLWDTDSMNLVGVYPDLAGAFTAVRHAVDAGARPRVGEWLLEQGEEPGEGEILARGEALIERAYANVPA